jgi:preprotein translocase subunit SecD
MNQYPAWKYLLVLLSLLAAIVYALPNIYGEDPALQITPARGFEIPPELQATIADALAAEQISYKSREQEGNRILFRFNSNEDQLLADTVLKKALGEQYVVALNLAHSTPRWLRAIGARPMTLGLDLQGGVHFLMQVDMETARGQQLDRFVDEIRAAMRDKGIRYVSVRREGNGLLVLLRSKEDRDSTVEFMQSDQSLQGLELVEQSIGDKFGISAKVKEAQLIELQQTALQQNVTTLRNRVNELGVAEPIIQQQGADRVVVQLPGLQDTAIAKTIIGATATLEYRAVDEQNDAFTAAQTGRVPPESRLYKQNTGQPVLLKKRLIVSGDQLIGASSGFDQQSGEPQVSVTLDNLGADNMLKFTRDRAETRRAQD